MDTKSRTKKKQGEGLVRLTDASVEAIEAPAKDAALSVLVFDTEIPGFHVQVTYKGTKTFRIRYRKTIGQETKWHSVKIGRWRKETRKRTKHHPKLDQGKAPDTYTADGARAVAQALRDRIDKGENPAAEAKLREIEQAKEAAAAMTVSQAWALYRRHIEERGNPMRPDSIVKVESAFELHILPMLGDRYLSTLTKSDVADLAAAARKQRQRKGRTYGGDVVANRVVAQLSAFLSWAMRRDPPLVAENVATKINRKDVLREEHARERYLTPEEWGAVMRELDEAPHWANRGSRYAETKAVRLDEPQLRQLVSCEALRVALLTGARSGEVFRMRWADVDLDGAWWRKPRETMKGKKTHEVALPRMAVESLRKLKAAHGDPVFVFPGKARLDAITSGKRLKGETGGHVLKVSETWRKIRAKLGIPDVRIHDLRHTHASVLISSGATLYEVGQALAHSQAQTTQRYAHLFDEAKRRTASRVDDFAEKMLNKTPAGVR